MKPEKPGSLWEGLYEGIEHSGLEDGSNLDISFIEPNDGTGGMNIMSRKENDLFSHLITNPDIEPKDTKVMAVERLFRHIFEVC